MKQVIESALPRLLLVLAAVSLTGCAEGGREDRVDSAVKIAAEHGMFGLKGEQAFPQFPIAAADLQSETGALTFTDQSTWTLDGTAGSRYELATTGALVFRVPNGRSADLVFQGGYGLEGDTGLFFFVDTVKPKVGMFFGARRVRGTANVEGEWHAFGLDVLTLPGGTVVDPNNLARAFAGTVTTDSRGILTAGTGSESTRLAMALTGSLSAFDNGVVEIGLTKDTTGAGGGDRVTRAYSAAATVTASQPVNTSVILGLETADNTAQGVVALIRKRDGRADTADLAGEYWMGIITIFASPTNAGTEGSHGTLTITKDGGWRLDAKDSRTTYRLTGTYEIDADGTMRLTNNATREAWRGAFDQDYKTIVFVDHDITGTSPSRPELNFFLGLRKKVTTP